ILEEILLDQLEVAKQEEAEKIRHCLRISGLLDRRIHQARHRRGWRRLNTLVALGRMRCPEAIPALAEGLDDPNDQVAIAAARGLGRYAMPEAAEPILERLEHGRLRLPANVLQGALYHCCRERPSLLLRGIHFADDRLRPLLARVLAEVASAELGEDLVQLASDPLPEVRASAGAGAGHRQSGCRAAAGRDARGSNDRARLEGRWRGGAGARARGVRGWARRLPAWRSVPGRAPRQWRPDRSGRRGLRPAREWLPGSACGRERRGCSAAASLAGGAPGGCAGRAAR